MVLREKQKCITLTVYCLIYVPLAFANNVRSALKSPVEKQWILLIPSALITRRLAGAEQVFGLTDEGADVSEAKRASDLQLIGKYAKVLSTQRFGCLQKAYLRGLVFTSAKDVFNARLAVVRIHTFYTN